MPVEDQIEETIERIVTAFGGGRLDEYFGSFHPDCTFVFHNAERRLESVDDYRRLWQRWVDEDGFEVLECWTTETRIQVWDDVAVVTHTVFTKIRTREGEEDLRERETIVLARQPDGRWLAIHEHLSSLPPS